MSLGAKIATSVATIAIIGGTATGIVMYNNANNSEEDTDVSNTVMSTYDEEDSKSSEDTSKEETSKTPTENIETQGSTTEQTPTEPTSSNSDNNGTSNNPSSNNTQLTSNSNNGGNSGNTNSGNGSNNRGQASQPSNTTQPSYPTKGYNASATSFFNGDMPNVGAARPEATNLNQALLNYINNGTAVPSGLAYDVLRSTGQVKTQTITIGYKAQYDRYDTINLFGSNKNFSQLACFSDPGSINYVIATNDGNGNVILTLYHLVCKFV